MNELKGQWDHNTKPSQFCVKRGSEEIYRGGYNQGYEILMNSKTPETYYIAGGNHVFPTEWAEQLERERDEARHEIEGWRNKWDCAIDMAARAEIERDEAIRQRDETNKSSKFAVYYAMEQNAKLIDIAERAIQDFNGCKAQQLREEINQIKCKND
jgi:hypothetical protein